MYFLVFLIALAIPNVTTSYHLTSSFSTKSDSSLVSITSQSLGAFSFSSIISSNSVFVSSKSRPILQKLYRLVNFLHYYQMNKFIAFLMNCIFDYFYHYKNRFKTFKLIPVGENIRCVINNFCTIEYLNFHII